MEESRQKILGVDFDDTLFLNSFPHNYTEPNWPVINYVKKRQQEGWYIILVTCRTEGEYINGAVVAAGSVGIYFDAINENHPYMISQFGDSRKIFCDEYIDDKCVSLVDVRAREYGFESASPTVYIAGKMRGLKGNGKQQFDAAARRLESMGFIVLNPSVLPSGLPDEKYMPICLSMLEAADCIYMLDNWSSSRGAIAELGYARCQGKRVIYEKDEEAGRTEYGDKENENGCGNEVAG